MQRPFWQRSASRQIHRALVVAGAKTIPVYRQPVDANGVATGEPQRIGCLFGMFYTRGQRDTVLIATPGIVARTDTDRLIATACGCARSVSIGDTLFWGSRKYKVLEATIHMDVALALVLEEV